jgi:2-aminoadipate transaminase
VNQEVLAPASPPDTIAHMKWESLFAERTRGARRSTVREFIKMSSQPGMISFAGGMPDPDLFPTHELEEALARVLKNRATTAMQYGEAEGLLELREWIAQDFSSRGVPLKSSDILITTGSQQGLDIVGRTLINPGDPVAVENPTYLAALASWGPLGPKFIPLETDANGLTPNAIQDTGRGNAKLLYTMPDFQNPTGQSLPLERRRLLIKAAAGARCPILEDNPYGALRYDGEEIPTLLELGWTNQNIIHIGTFSKTLIPGLRVGFLIAPPEFMEQAIRTKQPLDLHTSTFAQCVVLELLKANILATRLPMLRKAYGERCHAMFTALKDEMPEEVTWTKPNGGFFIFATLPDGVASADLLKRTLAEKVAFVPGDEFHIGDSGRNTLRLNFTKSKPQDIQTGIQRIAKCLKEMLSER